MFDSWPQGSPIPTSKGLHTQMFVLKYLPSGKHTKKLLKIAIEIFDLPFKNGGSFHSDVSLPEGTYIYPQSDPNLEIQKFQHEISLYFHVWKEICWHVSTEKIGAGRFLHGTWCLDTSLGAVKLPRQ